MVLESIFEAEGLEHNPLEMALLSVAFVAVAVFAALTIGAGFSPDAVSILAVALVALPSMPVILRLFERTEMRDENDKFLGSHTLGRHAGILIVLALYFTALVLTFTVLYLILPVDQGSVVFAAQNRELTAISSISGRAIDFAVSTGAATAFLDRFEYIFLHNLQVLVFVIILSAVYGAGAVMILSWNASVIGAFIGQFARTLVAHTPGVDLFSGASVGFLGLVPHGSFELLSYSAGALAGGILSAAIVNRHHREKIFLIILKDITKLAAWAVLFLAIGAAIESGALAF